MRLQTLSNRFITKALNREIGFTLSTASTAHRSYEVIRLYAEWEDFCRALFVASVVRGPYYVDGGYAARVPHYANTSELANDLRQRSKGRPIYWGTSSVFSRWCRIINPSNQSVLVDAMTANGSKAESLRDVRNFLAHRNESTYGRVNRVNQISNANDLISWLSSPAVGGRSIFGTWVQSLSDVASASIRRP